MVEEKVSKKVIAAEKAYHALRDAARILRNQKKIANQPLPAHKQKKFDGIVTDCITKEFNANQAFEAAVRKLNKDDERVLKERLGLI